MSEHDRLRYLLEAATAKVALALRPVVWIQDACNLDAATSCLVGAWVRDLAERGLVRVVLTGPTAKIFGEADCPKDHLEAYRRQLKTDDVSLVVVPPASLQEGVQFLKAQADCQDVCLQAAFLNAVGGNIGDLERLVRLYRAVAADGGLSACMARHELETGQELDAFLARANRDRAGLLTALRTLPCTVAELCTRQAMHIYHLERGGFVFVNHGTGKVELMRRGVMRSLL
jgi:hypothetical protein